MQKHVSHCVGILRQQLMCTVDIGVLGQVSIQFGSSHMIKVTWGPSLTFSNLYYQRSNMTLIVQDWLSLGV